MKPIFLIGILMISLLGGVFPKTDKTQSRSVAWTKKQETAKPCDSASTQLEMNECAGEQFRRADARLNGVYGRLVSLLKNSPAGDAKVAVRKSDENEAIRNLREAERAWIAYRNLHCEAAGKQYEGGSIRPLMEANCLELVTRHRIEELKEGYETPDLKLE